MKQLLELSDEELIEQAALTDPELDLLESKLKLKAACLGWDGDPLQQPLETVAAIVRSIVGARIG